MRFIDLEEAEKILEEDYSLIIDTDKHDSELLDKVAKRLKSEFPIMENDFGLIVNENVHKEVDKIIAEMKAEVSE